MILLVLVLSGSQTVAAASADQLVAHWAFDEGSQGASATDDSGNANPFTPAGSGGGPTYSTDVPVVSFTDPYSTSFNGSQYFSASASNSLDQTNGLSFSVWVKFANVSGNQTIAAKWEVGVKQQWVVQLNSGHISFWTGDGSTGSVDNLQSNALISTNTWYNITGTYTSGSKKLYINGSLDKSDGATVLGTASGTPFTVGSKQNSVGTFFEYLSGQIDDIRVYNQELSAGAVSDLAAGKDIDAPAPTLTSFNTIRLYKGDQNTTAVLAGAAGSPDASTLAIISGPDHGSASVNQGSGSITYRPAANYVGADSITFSVCSAAYQSACSQTTLTYSVVAAPNPANIKPPDTGYGSGRNPDLLAVSLLGLAMISMVIGLSLLKPARKN